MKKRNAVIITLLSFLLVIGLTACKHRGPHLFFDEFFREAAVKRIAAQLDLTDIQKSDLNQIVTDLAQRAKEMHTESEKHRRDVTELLQQDRIPRDAVDRLINDRMNRMKELADLVKDRVIDLHASLTPDQRDKLIELIEERHARHQSWFK